MALIEGTNRPELLIGTDEGDDIFLFGGNDTVRGLGGNDGLWSSRGNDLFIGDEGRDRIDYRNDPAGILFDFRTGQATDGWGNTDRFQTVERVVGSQFADRLFGNGADNSFSGERGDDLINGGGGEDFIWFGRTANAVVVDLGNGTARGEGNDTLVSIEHMGGSNFADRLTGSDSDNWINPDQFGDIYTPNYRRGGADTVDGGGGFDTVSYWNSLAGVTVNLALGTGRDGAGNTDRLRNIEAVEGSAFADRLTGDTRGNLLAGIEGRDRLVGGRGQDTLEGGEGNDRFVFLERTDTGNVIADFATGDRIEIAVAGFGGGLARGALADEAFAARAFAADADDRFLYRQSDGKLWFDVNGNAAGGRTLIADLADGTALGATDFVLI